MVWTEITRPQYRREGQRHEQRPGIAELEIEWYSKVKELPTYYNGLGITILSTARGVMSNQEARAAHVGGEVLCRVF